MKENVLKYGEMYQKICHASRTGNQLGIPLKELQKEYGIRKRDIPQLLNFLFTQMNEGRISYNLYRLKKDTTSSFDDLEEGVDFEEVDMEDMISGQKITPLHYIRIEDEIDILIEKIQKEDMEISNLSMIQKFNPEVRSLWEKVSNIKMDSAFVIRKGEREETVRKIQENKRLWVDAIVNQKSICLDRISNEGKVQHLSCVPVGLYYNKVLEIYKGVYWKEKGSYEEIELGKVKKIRFEGERKQGVEAFSMEQYLTSVQTVKIVLKVYKEGKVREKLEKLLSDNQLTIQRGEAYDLYLFMAEETEEIEKYGDVFKGYGRSIIVKEPEKLKTYMIEYTNDALEAYTKYANGTEEKNRIG